MLNDKWFTYLTQISVLFHKNSCECVGEDYCFVGPFSSEIFASQFFEHFPLGHAAKTRIREIWDNNQSCQSIHVYCKRLWYIHAAFSMFIPHRSENIDLERWLNIVWICCPFAWWCAMWVNVNTSFLFHLRTFAMSCQENTETKNEILAASWALSLAEILVRTSSVIESTFGLL